MICLINPQTKDCELQELSLNVDSKNLLVKIFHKYLTSESKCTSECWQSEQTLRLIEKYILRKVEIKIIKIESQKYYSNRRYDERWWTTYTPAQTFGTKTNEKILCKHKTIKNKANFAKIECYHTRILYKERNNRNMMKYIDYIDSMLTMFT